MKRGDVAQLSKAFKALSNPNRLQIFLNLLKESEVDLAAGKVHDCFLATLLGNLNVGAPTVSHHVKELANADLITTHRDGKQLICSINPKVVDKLRELFDTTG